MKPRALPYLLLTAGFLCVSGVLQAKQETVYVCYGTDGAVSMGNTPSGDNCEQIASDVPVATPTAPPPAAASRSIAAGREGSAAGGATGATPDAATSRADTTTASAPAENLPPLETRLANYRQSMLQGASGAGGAPAAALNRAVSRRYLMSNHAAFVSGR